MTHFVVMILSFSCFKNYLIGQSRCETVKTGLFYFNPKPGTKFKIIRDNEGQQEIDLKTGDTTFWSSSWIQDCVLLLSFIKSSTFMSEQRLHFWKSHKVIIKITDVEKDYYLFKTGIDSLSDAPKIDTMSIVQKSPVF